ncbi:hypothetical protein GFL54_27915 [Rhizobium laguerreae]|uniref:hypothetical protein n=1 Tax=Rhizobium laguerreae TaxID=1076926 RepID=UPI00143FB3A9|nr:hypothetical protein [Rhizobium laguerreae]NKM88054.1 hypothetical protein [Rhizobium laguerreae]
MEFDQPLWSAVFCPSFPYWETVGGGGLIEYLEGLKHPTWVQAMRMPAVSGLWTLTVTAVQGTSMEGRNASFYQQIAEDVLDLTTPELREWFRLGMRTHGDEPDLWK